MGMLTGRRLIKQRPFWGLLHFKWEVYIANYGNEGWMEQIWTLESDYVGTMEARVNGGGVEGEGQRWASG